MSLQKEIERLSPWASVFSLALGLYWKFYPQSLMSISQGQIIDTSSVSIMLIVFGLILMLIKYGGKKK